MTVDSKTRGKWPGLDERRLALVLLLVAPALFCSNMLVARATHDLFPPVALAFWRWTATLALLLPFTAAALWRHRYDVLREWRDILVLGALGMGVCGARSEEHTSELQSLMRISYAVFCLKKKKHRQIKIIKRM